MYTWCFKVTKKISTLKVNSFKHLHYLVTKNFLSLKCNLLPWNLFLFLCAQLILASRQFFFESQLATFHYWKHVVSTNVTSMSETISNPKIFIYRFLSNLRQIILSFGIWNVKTSAILQLISNWIWYIKYG